MVSLKFIKSLPMSTVIFYISINAGEQKQSVRPLKSLFIVSDDFERHEDIISFYVNESFSQKFDDYLYSYKSDGNSSSHANIYKGFNTIFDSESSYLNAAANISSFENSAKDSLYADEESNFYSSESLEDDTYHDPSRLSSYYDSNNNLLLTKTKNSTKLKDFDGGNFDGDYDDPYEDDEYYADEGSIEGRSKKPRNQGSPSTSSGDDLLKYTNDINGVPFVGNIDENAIMQLYEVEVLKFYDQSTNRVNNSLLIYGGDLVHNMTLFKEVVRNRIDSNTLIIISSNGQLNVDNADIHELILSVSSYASIPSVALPTMNLLSALKESVPDPLQIHLDSSYAGDLSYTFSPYLHEESVLITNSKHQHNIISCLASLKHSYLVHDDVPVSKSGEFNNDSDPYNKFLSRIEVEAVMYAKFITGGFSSNTGYDRENRLRNKITNAMRNDQNDIDALDTDIVLEDEQNEIDVDSKVFELFPSFRLVQSNYHASMYLNKQMRRFISFASGKIWVGKRITIPPRIFTEEQIYQFNGNLLLQFCSTGESEFISYLEEQILHRNNKYLRQLLLQYQLLNDCPVHVAITFGNTRILQLAIRLFQRRLVDFDVNMLNGYGESLVLTSCLNNRIDALKILLEEGANVNIPSDSGMTPLHATAVYGNFDIARLLIEHGALINQRETDGSTPLHIAVQNNHIKLVTLLVENDADYKSKKVNGNTALHLASIRGYFDMVKLLMSLSINVNDVNENHSTALFMACQEGHVNIARLLLRYNADVNNANIQGMTPIYVAAAFGRIEIVKLLIDYGADVNKETVEGFSPLFVAHQEGYRDVIKILVKEASNKICDDKRCYL